MLGAIWATFSDFWRFSADETSGIRIVMSYGDTKRRLRAATENQGVASSNLALGTRPDVHVRHLGANDFGCRATDLRHVHYSYFGTYATLPVRFCWPAHCQHQMPPDVGAMVIE